MVATIIALIYFVGVSVIVGLITKKQVSGAGSFIKAGQGMGWIAVSFGFCLIPLGAGHTLSLWEQVPMLGASALWWGIAAGGIYLPIMMMWFGPLIRKTGSLTVPDLLDKIIGRTFGRFYSGITIGAWTGIGSAETLATAAAVYGLAGGSIAFIGCIGIALALIIIYVIFGGILQMAWLNVVNGIVMIACSYIALAFMGVWVAANMGGWIGVQQIYESWGRFDMLQTYNLGIPPMWFNVIIPVIVIHVMSAGIAQNANSPFFAAKDDAACRKGTIVVAGFNFGSSFPWIVIALVAFAITQTPDLIQKFLPNMIDNPDQAKLAPVQLIIEALPAPVVGMMMIALLCATLSTGGSIVIANANILTNDIFKKCLKPDMSEKTRYTLIRVSVFISAAFFAVPAFLNAVLFPVFIWCFTFGIPIFVIYMMSMKVRVNQRAAWLTIIIVYAVSFLWTFTPIAAALGVADGPLGLNLYPVFILSIILGVILPLVVPGGSKAWLKTDAAERERIAMGE